MNSVFMAFEEKLRGESALRTLLFAFYLVCAIFFQWRGNAYGSELSGSSDEPAHYVTGLMVHDYVAAGLPGSPLAYARNYYLHYPKVGLGHWPPVFYIVQATWMLLFPTSPISVLLLMATITALLATVVCEVLRKEFSIATGIASGAVLISLPIIEAFNQLVMAEILVAVLVLLAALAYGRYLDTENWQPAAWFGFWFAAALLTKGTAIQLALVPPVSLLLSRRWHLLRRFSFWLPAILVLGIAGPWYARVPGAQHESVARFGGLKSYESHSISSLTAWANMLGVVLVCFTILGLWVRSREIFLGSVSGKWSVFLSVLFGAYVARLFIGAYEERHLLVNLPVLIMFAAAGVDWCFRQPAWRTLAIAPRFLLIGAGLTALCCFHIYRSPLKRHYGFSEAAEDLLVRPELKNSVFLVAGGGKTEGTLIAEVAAREARPGHIILRASKMLASEDWMGWKSHLRFQDQEEILGYLESIPVGIVILDEDGQRTAYGQLLYNGLRAHPEKWELLADYPPISGPTRRVGNIVVYRLLGHEGKPLGKIRIPMTTRGYGSFEN
jgi:hypothetical protein